MLCNHDISDEKNCSLQAIIKRPMQFLTEEEKKKAEFEPDAKCISCGKEFKIDFTTMKGVVCVRYTR